MSRRIIIHATPSGHGCGCGPHYLVTRPALQWHTLKPLPVSGTEDIHVLAHGTLDEDGQEMLVNVLTSLCLRWDLGVGAIYGHDELEVTDCPGLDVSDLRTQVADLKMGLKAVA